MSESQAKITTFTGTTGPKPDDKHRADLGAEIRRQQELETLTIRMHGAPRPKHRSQTRTRPATTPEQKRMAKIRGLLKHFTGCPDPETYCEWMDRARITLPEVCRGIANGPKNYREAYLIPRFAASIRSEKARAWDGLNS
jgi:hypothetical protein